MESPRSILFLCPHNAAKSLLAAADFDRLAAARGLPFRADSAGTDPADGPALAVVATLRAEDIDVGSHQPRLVTEADMASAHRVVSMGCNPDDLPVGSTPIERWDDVPPVSEDLVAARHAIQRHVETLVDDLASEATRAR
jgi:arsenate reductase (thioredoxin)